MKKTVLFLLGIAFTATIVGQPKGGAPTPVEIFFGHERVNLTLMMNKNIGGKFKYNNITSTAAYYDYAKGKTELVSVNSLIYQINPMFGASAGMQWHFLKGFIPSVAAHFTYADPTWLFVVTPYLNFMPWMNSETVAIAEYKPILSNGMRLFTRVQGFYSYNFETSNHERSMVYLRLGLRKDKYTAGFAANFDNYGPNAIVKKDNFGAFLSVAL